MTQQLRQQLLQYLKAHKGQAFKQRRLANALHIPASHYPEFKQLLRNLADNGQIERGRRNSYRLPDSSKYVAGIISYTARGFAFVQTDDQTELFVPARDAAPAWHHDRVLVERFIHQSGKREQGKVIRILQRANEPLFAVLVKEDHLWRAIPENPAPLVRIDIWGDESHFCAGKMVELTRFVWDSAQNRPRAEVKQILGTPLDARDDLIILKKMYRLPTEFPARVMKAAQAIKALYPDSIAAQRRDYRGQTVITIDPPEARDFDDAIGLIKNPDGSWLLTVHISDVSHFVPHDSVIDLEARRRGTSIYFTDDFIPMLPERLTTDLCSLQPGVDRYTLSVELRLDSRGAIDQCNIVSGVIRSARRFSYTEVQHILDRGEGDYYALLADMRQLSRQLNDLRSASGSIDFEIPEPVFSLDREGVPLDIKPSVRLESHRIVEEFMLLANRSVTDWVHRLDASRIRPFIYRIHEPPTARSIKGLYEILGRFGLSYRQPEKFLPIHLRQILLDIEELPIKHYIEQVALRSMTKASYSHRPSGHFGLAFSRYTHFTSPIRRYPDLMVHRLLKRYLNGVGETEIRYFRRALPPIARQCSTMELRALEVERAYIRLKQIRFLAQKIGQWYAGYITGVVESGFFVEIADYLVEGFVHVRTLSDDFYQYDEVNHQLRGQRQGRRFRLGDQVKVRVHSVSVAERRIDLEWGE